jgi:hypothetical protein
VMQPALKRRVEPARIPSALGQTVHIACQIGTLR